MGVRDIYEVRVRAQRRTARDGGRTRRNFGGDKIGDNDGVAPRGVEDRPRNDFS